MAMFRQSSIVFSAAKYRVAEVAGASDSTDMVTRAGYAVQQAMDHWANSHNWSYLLTTHTPITVVAPITVPNCSTDSSTTLSTTGGGFSVVTVNDVVVGSGIRPDTTVVSVSGGNNALIMTRAATATNAGPLDMVFYRREYGLPSDFKTMYNVRTTGNPQALRAVDHRQYDRAVGDQSTTGSPYLYSLFTQGTYGKIRLIPTPSSEDTLLLKYYRATTAPSGDSDALDIPADYEWYILALAKAFFLADKGGEPERMKFWWEHGLTGLRQARADDARAPDADQGFVPGMANTYPANPNAVWPYLGDY